MGAGRPATAPNAGCASSSGWIARFSSHRKRAPQGLAGGGDGEVGRTLVRRLDGSVEELAACAQTVLEPGEAVTVITPTPGGYGAAGEA